MDTVLSTMPMGIYELQGERFYCVYGVAFFWETHRVEVDVAWAEALPLNTTPVTSEILRWVESHPLYGCLDALSKKSLAIQETLQEVASTATRLRTEYAIFGSKADDESEASLTTLVQQLLLLRFEYDELRKKHAEILREYTPDT